MSGRDAILAKVRTALGVEGADTKRRAAVDDRIATRHRHPTPARVAGKSHDEHIATFRAYLEAQQTTVIEADRAAIPAAIARYLRETNLPSRVRMGADPWLAGLDWASEPTLSRLHGRAAPDDEVAVSKAVSGVAETGTLVLASGQDNPVTLTFMPETHIVVVERTSIVGPYEDAIAKIRNIYGDGQMPRTVNLVSGASRTGDIGGRIVMGAHGPRRLCVIIVRT